MSRALVWSHGGYALEGVVEELLRRHAEVIVAIDGIDHLVERWSAARALKAAWCTLLSASPASLEERTLALPARLGDFDHVWTDDPRAFACLARFGFAAQLGGSGSSAPATLPSRERALVVTRAQPFHRGHLALIDRALELASEVIVVVASAEHSHAPRNPFTAGERLRMIRAGLGWRDERCWLLALPSPTWPASALRELALYAPPYQTVVAHNPVLTEMAEQLGKRVVGLPEPVRAGDARLSASHIRARLVAEGAGPWLDELVPNADVFAEPSLARRCARIAEA